MENPEGRSDEDLVHDELAALFLSPGSASAPSPRPTLRLRGDDEPRDPPPPLRDTHDTDAPPRPRRRGGPALEAALLGHLPVRASLWLRQYASSCGERTGLVRLGGGSVRVEMIGGDEEPPAGPLDAQAAVAWLGAHAERVIFACDEMGQADLPGQIGAERVCVLSAANDAAVIHAYKLIKAVSAVSDAPVDFTVAIAGEDDARSRAASERIRVACERFLGVEAEVGPPVGRVAAARAITLHAGAGSPDPAALSARLRGGPAHGETPAPSIASSRVGPAASGADAAQSDATSGLLGWIPDVSRLDLPCPVSSNVVFASDAAGHGHAVSDAAHLTELHRAGAWWNQNRRLIAALHPGLVAASCLHLHVVTRDHRSAVALAGGGYRSHWITRGTSASGSRLIAVEVSPADA